ALVSQVFDVLGELVVEDLLELGTQRAGQGRAGRAGGEGDAQAPGADQRHHHEVRRLRLVVGADQDAPRLAQLIDLLRERWIALDRVHRQVDAVQVGRLEAPA